MDGVLDMDIEAGVENRDFVGEYGWDWGIWYSL